MRITRNKFLTELVSISKVGTAKLAFIKDNITIIRLFTSESKVIKGVGSDSNKVDNVDIVNTKKKAG